MNERQLKQISESYDKAIEYGSKGIDLYEELPAEITNDPDYETYKSFDLSDSDRQEIYDYLAPAAEMKFVDLGCCLNLVFRGYDTWRSSYYAVDISPKTIQLLEYYVETNNLSIGDLHCGSIHETPYADHQFDIGTCIGVLEYFQQDFVEAALQEMRRIIKPGGKLVLDIPAIGSPECRIAMMIEAYLGRPDTFDLSQQEFESLLENDFILERKEKVGPMIQYFLKLY